MNELLLKLQNEFGDTRVHESEEPKMNEKSLPSDIHIDEEMSAREEAALLHAIHGNYKEMKEQVYHSVYGKIDDSGLDDYEVQRRDAILKTRLASFPDTGTPLKVPPPAFMDERFAHDK